MAWHDCGFALIASSRPTSESEPTYRRQHWCDYDVSQGCPWSDIIPAVHCRPCQVGRRDLCFFCMLMTLNYTASVCRRLLTSYKTNYIIYECKNVNYYCNISLKSLPMWSSLPLIGFIPLSSPFGDNHSTRKSAAPEAWTLNSRMRHQDEKSYGSVRHIHIIQHTPYSYTLLQDSTTQSST